MVIYDISRLLSRIDTSTPTGIDRVDMRYFFHIYHRYPNAQFVFLSCGKFCIADRNIVFRVFDTLQKLWLGKLNKSQQRSLSNLKAKLFYKLVTLRKKSIRVIPSNKQVSYLSQSLKQYIHQNKKVTYINSSHTNLDKTHFFEELKQLDVKIAVILYDLIPVTHPEYCRTEQVSIHKKRMYTLAKYADRVLAISKVTKQEFLAFVNEQEWQFEQSAVVVNYLGTEDLSKYLVVENESTHKESKSLDISKPYFLMIGTIEPRKNHLFLLHIWRDLAKELGSACPTCYIVGKRGWINDQTVAMLERCPSIQPFVQELSDISDHQLAKLMQGAKGLLMPSFVEGWGLPVAEALMLDTPVICNDIEVFKEVGQDVAQLISVNEFASWKAQIKKLITQDENTGLKNNYNAVSWQKHFDYLDKQIN